MSEDRRLFFMLNIGQRRVQRWIDRKAETETRASAAQAGALFCLAKQDGAPTAPLRPPPPPSPPAISR
ncbi:hypothetical protein FOZ70_05170, partial [Burkholderia sp. COPS]|nr:hypothetical protein [Burkholderia sp. COPS]